MLFFILNPKIKCQRQCWILAQKIILETLNYETIESTSLNFRAKMFLGLNVTQIGILTKGALSQIGFRYSKLPFFLSSSTFFNNISCYTKMTKKLQNDSKELKTSLAIFKCATKQKYDFEFETLVSHFSLGAAKLCMRDWTQEFMK